MDAESLEFPDRSFDTVISSLALCTFPDPVAALREMARVCRTDGRILLLEHGRSNRDWIADWQDRHADLLKRHADCHWNRNPLALLNQAGLTLLDVHFYCYGMVNLIQAKP